MSFLMAFHVVYWMQKQVLNSEFEEGKK